MEPQPLRSIRFGCALNNHQDASVVAAVREAFLHSDLHLSHSPRTTVLAAFVAVPVAAPSATALDPPTPIVVLSLGVGTRSVGFAKVGVDDSSKLLQWQRRRLFTLDDGHAEIMARRGLVAYLLGAMRQRLDDAVSPPTWTPIAYDADAGLFEWRPNVALHLVVSQVPCGAFGVTPSLPEHSTGAHVLMASPSPVQAPLEPLPAPARAVKLHMGHTVSHVMDESLHTLRAVARTKPGAGAPSLSMSCSDKILKWWVDGVQGACLNPLLKAPIHMHRLHIATPFAHRAPLEERRAMWLSDAADSVAAAFLRVSNEGAADGSHVAACVSWFPVELLSDDDKRHASSASPSNESLPEPACPVSAAAWLSSSALPTGCRWHVATINSKDGCSFGVTKSRLAIGVEAVATAPCSGQQADAMALAQLAGAVLRALRCEPAVDAACVADPHACDAPSITDEAVVRRLLHLGGGIGASPILRWSIGIAAAHLVERCSHATARRQRQGDGHDGTARRSVVSPSSMAAGPEVPSTTMPDPSSAHPAACSASGAALGLHPYYVFKRLQTPPPPSVQRGACLWVYKDIGHAMRLPAEQ